MRKYLLPENGNFYRANLHTHTTVSDGMLTPEEVKSLYKKYGYSVVAYTDHEVFLTHNELTDDGFLALNGFEATIVDDKPFAFGTKKVCHFCFIAYDKNNDIQPCFHRTSYNDGKSAKSKHLVKFDEYMPDYERSYGGEVVSKFIKDVKSAGFFATYNHPGWSYEGYNDYMNYEGIDAFEIMNGSSLIDGYHDYNPSVYDDMIRGGKRLFCIGADDNHNRAQENTYRFDSARAFTVIKAEKLEYGSIMSALQRGDFYASEAPEIYSLYLEDGKVFVKCSDAACVCCNYGVRRAGRVANDDGSPVNEAVFKLPENYGYFRITVTDMRGLHACTNAFFEEDME